MIPPTKLLQHYFPSKHDSNHVWRLGAKLLSRSYIAGTNRNEDRLPYHCLETRMRFSPEWSKPLGDTIQNTEAASSHIKNIMEMNKLPFLLFLPEKIERKCVQIPATEGRERGSCISGYSFLCHGTVTAILTLGGGASASRNGTRWPHLLWNWWLSRWRKLFPGCVSSQAAWAGERPETWWRVLQLSKGHGL